LNRLWSPQRDSISISQLDTIKLTEKKNKKGQNCNFTRSPSIMYLETSSLSVISSSSVSSFVILLSIWISQRICFALVLPTPWMYCSEYSIRLLFGISTPPTRTHLMLDPWTCTHSNQSYTPPIHVLLCETWNPNYASLPLVCSERERRVCWRGENWRW